MQARFTIKYYTRWGESLSIVINDVKHPMQWMGDGLWQTTVRTAVGALKHYGYVVMCDGLVTRMEWKSHTFDGCSKVKGITDIRDSWIDCPFEGCPFPREHQAAMFDRPGFRGAGTAVPVFALRSADDFGIGEFRDIKFLVDWAVSTGQRVIQLLPVTDTTRRGGWEDSYPYSPVSSFALHPLYLSLKDMGVDADSEYLAIQKEVNSLPEIDYPRVFQTKMRYIKRIFVKSASKDMESASFRRFCRENAFWLDDYSEFCARRDGSPDFYRWVQFHLDRQLYETAEYARSRGVALKGDLPIGVSADSADAWKHPELFNLDSCAGAPPDFFSRDGQNWGFPTYNWEEMAKDDYAWWKARLRHMSRYFDAFRIDHILGFFRIWEIPADFTSGVMGHFNPALPYSGDDIAGLPVEGLFLPDPRNKGCWQPVISPDTTSLTDEQKRRFDSMYEDFFFHRHNEFWRRNALKKLPELLGATGMLACGEDLGMVPDCVNGVMDSQKILSLEMADMEKGRPWPYLSVCTTSSHDTETMRMKHLRCTGRDMDAIEARNVLAGHLSSQSMLAIFPVQDWLAMDSDLRREDPVRERINEPADPHHHWRYRLHLNLEEMLSADGLNRKVSELIRNSSR